MIGSIFNTLMSQCNIKKINNTNDYVCVFELIDTLPQNSGDEITFCWHPNLGN